MAQHFLLSAASRTLSLKSIYKAGEQAAYDTFCKIRWADTNGKAVCPKCGCTETYDISTRRRFKCVACHSQFSVTSGTMFASRKLSFCDLLAAICLFVNGSKGMSSVQFSRDLDVQYKTAWVLAHKLREALGTKVHTGEEMEGTVEVDGAYFGGHIRPHNIREKRVDRRLKKHQTGTRRVVVAFRERKGRTLPFITKSEAQGVELAKIHVSRSAHMAADEASHWDLLHDGWSVDRINHSELYSDHGKHTNMVESYFSRLRRMVRGQHHHVSQQYLHQYANHAAWLEDNRRNSNGDNALATLGGMLCNPVSRVWAGYWQRSLG